jgi:hypothetical protein
VAGDHFGSSVAISGKTTIMGAYERAKGAGRAYVFTKMAGRWAQVGELTRSGTAAWKSPGLVVAISGAAGATAVSATGGTVGVTANGPTAVKATGGTIGVDASCPTAVQAAGTTVGLSASGQTAVAASGGTIGVSASGPTALAADGTTVGVSATGPIAISATGATTGVTASGPTAVVATGTTVGISANAPTGVSVSGTGPLGRAIVAGATSKAAAVHVSNGGTGPALRATTGTGGGMAGTGCVVGDSHEATGVLGLSEGGDGVRGHSKAGRSGSFSGGAAQIKLTPGPGASHPATGQTGDLYCDRSGRLWFCKSGGAKAVWRELA